MATLAQLGAIANTVQFQQRVQAAMLVAATNVYSEVSTTSGHTIRASYANKVANGQFNVLGAAYAVLGNSTIAAEATVPTSGVQITNGSSLPASNVLKFAAVASWVVPGTLAAHLTNSALISSPASVVTTTTATTVTLSANVIGTVAVGDNIFFTGVANGNAIPDSDIQFAVNSVWNLLAWA